MLPGSGRKLLMGLPGMTEEIADAILDYMDEDDEPREFGAERDAYASLEPPYEPKNGPLHTVEELLLVLGVTPYLLFGTDANRNGLADMHEGGDRGIDRRHGEPRLVRLPHALQHGGKPQRRGAAAHLSQRRRPGEALQRRVGRRRSPIGPRSSWPIGNSDPARAPAASPPAVNSGGSDESKSKALPNRRRIAGQRHRSPGRRRSPAASRTSTKPAKTKINNVLDLIGAKVNATFEGEKEATLVASPFPSDPLAMNALPAPAHGQLHGHRAAIAFPARININQAPRCILMGIPGMTEEIADKIIAEREPEADPRAAAAAVRDLDHERGAGARWPR